MTSKYFTLLTFIDTFMKILLRLETTGYNNYLLSNDSAHTSAPM